MLLSILITSFTLLAMLFCIAKFNFFKIKSLPRFTFIILFGVKLMAMLCIWWVYTYYYTDQSKADIYKYYEDAMVLHHEIGYDFQLLTEALSPWNSPSEKFQESLQNTMHWDQQNAGFFNDNKSMIRINLIFSYFTNGFFHLHALLFTFFSFIGSVALLRLFTDRTKIATPVLVIAIFLIPSTLFWTSSTLKESWLFFSFGFFLYFTNQWLQNKESKYIILACCSLLISMGVKVYVFAILLPLIFFLLVNYFSKATKTINFIGSQFLFLAALIILKGKTLLLTLQQKLISFNQVAVRENAGSAINLDIYQNYIEFIKEIPKGLYNVFVQPIYPPTLNVLSLLSAIECLFLLTLPLLILFYAKKPRGKQLTFSLFSIGFVLYLAVLIGMTTNVLGAIVRYKVPLIPFYIVALLTFVEQKNLPFLKQHNENST